MENLNFFLYDLLPKFLLGGVIVLTALGVLFLIMEFIENIIPAVLILIGILMVGCFFIIFPVFFYTVGNAVINGTFWELVNGMV